jgi:hypothetical protein
MKLKLRFLILLIISGNAAFSQTQCAPAQAYLAFNANNIRTFLSPNGSFCYDPTSFEAGFEVPYSPGNPSNPATIFASGLWLGGLDPAGNLKLAASTYNSPESFDFSPGPLDAIEGTTNQNNCSDFDKIWSVSQGEILQHLADCQDNGIIDNPIPAIFAWPGLNNPLFEQYNGFPLPDNNQGMAPFFDTDSDNVYSPAAGDYPIVFGLENIPDQIAWYVFNDAGAAHSNTLGNIMQMEVQVTAYAYNCDDIPELNNALFLRLRLINRAVEDIDSLYLGFWTDFDLGCYEDDYVGCNPELNTYFAYNADNADNNCMGIPGYGENPPVQAITFLDRPMDGFRQYYNFSLIDIINPIPDPTSPPDYYRYLSGSWPDGTLLTTGGLGYNPGSTDITSWVFPDNPNDPAGWSMYSVDSVFGANDVRGLGITYLDKMEPGAIEELDLCLSYHRETGSDHLSNVNVMETEVALLKNLYSTGFNTACLVSKEPILHYDHDIIIFPNPADASVIIRSASDKILSYQISDMQGRVVIGQTGLSAKEVPVDIDKIVQGIYQVQVTIENGIYVIPLAVIR